ncbi:MAG: FecR domain-containing protein [Deltaproteobacteria bacterium]|nr:FecR domain-containing protein [Deltaproteobacteria bacterium]
MKSKLFCILFCFLWLVGGAAAGWADDDRTIELTVARNDSLIKLCRKILADPSRWPEIGRINRLKDFDLIHPGQVLIVPVRLLQGVPLDGRVIFVKGDVTFQTAAGGVRQPLAVNDTVRQGHLLRTGRESSVEIAFADGTSFFQRPDTTLGLDVAERRGERHLFQRLVLEAGRMLLHIRKATGQESRIEIQTPSATAVARGTDFRVSADTREVMTAEVLQGSIDVAAMKQVVALNQGEGTAVKKGEPPLPPRKLLSPPVLQDPQTLYRTLPLVLRFGGGEGAVAYRALLSSDPEGREVLREKVVGAGEPLQLADLADGTYYLQGWGIDHLGIEGLPLAPQPIRLRVNPRPPFIQEPVADAAFKGRSVSFRWLKVKEAVRYELQIASDREFRDPSEKPEVIDGVSRERTFRDFGTYYFRIRSVASDDYRSLWSDAAAFTLVPPPPSPILEKPAVDAKELRIRWQNQGEKMSYRCQIAREESFHNPILEKRVTGPEIALPTPREPGIYYVRTSTIDPTGYEGGFSPPQSFEIGPGEAKKGWEACILGGVGLAALLLLILP